MDPTFGGPGAPDLRVAQRPPCAYSASPFIQEVQVERIIRAPRGSEKRCKGWVQEAALRMLMNNLDPDVAEAPQDLVVYGGTGKAARDWPSFDRIVATLEELEDDETLLVQS